MHERRPSGLVALIEVTTCCERLNYCGNSSGFVPDRMAFADRFDHGRTLLCVGDADD